MIKIALIFALLAFGLFKFLTRKKAPDGFLTIDDGRANRLLLSPGIPKENLDAFLTEYEGKNYHRHDNLFHKLSGILPDPAPGTDYADYFNQLNTSQRIYAVLLQMDGQINNGGVYQFLWNRPEMIYAAAEALHELGIEPLDEHFSAVLKELESNSADFARDKRVWNDPAISHEQKWTVFQEGRRYIPTGDRIEAYFYTDEFAQYFHGKVMDYLREHRASFGVPA